jgi:hypothetical protein
MRDRAGDEIDPDTPDPFDRAHDCRRGWRHTPNAAQPLPCPICRPWLAARPPRPPTGRELDAFRRRHPTPPRTPR